MRMFVCSPPSTQGHALVTILVLIAAFAGSHLAFDDDDHGHQGFHDESVQEHARAHETASAKEGLSKDKVLLSTVEALTFTRHKRTTSRRTHSIHQLSCVGGTAGCKLFTPDVVECRNKGLDKMTGKQVWTCHAEMSERVKFNHVEVICEGYDYPEDDYILLGSCGLEFTLDYVDPHDYHDQSYFKHMDEHEKELHHERVRDKQRQEEPTDQLLMARLTTVVSSYFRGSYLLLSIVVIIVILAALVRYATALRSESPHLLGGSERGRKKNATIGGGGRAGGGYGPLTSAVMATKKAC